MAATALRTSCQNSSLPDSVGNSLLFDNGSAVGLGTSTPVGKLHVKSGDLYGGFFETSFPHGIALVGQATNTDETNPATGVMGISAGPDGTGVDGFGSTIGVRGRGTFGVVGISSGKGAGVAGSGSGSSPGGYFFNLDGNGKALVVGATNRIEVLTVRSNGKVGIQNPDPGEALDVNGNVKANGLCLGSDCRSVWPDGSGTVTSVTPIPGLGLTGGGTSGAVSLGIATGGVTNAMLQDSTVLVNTPTGSGLTGGGLLRLGGNLTLSIPTSGVTNGMLQNPSISLNVSPTSGLTGGGPTALGSATSIAVDFTRYSKTCLAELRHRQRDSDGESGRFGRL